MPFRWWADSIIGMNEARPESTVRILLTGLWPYSAEVTRDTREGLTFLLEHDDVALQLVSNSARNSAFLFGASLNVKPTAHPHARPHMPMGFSVRTER